MSNEMKRVQQGYKNLWIITLKKFGSGNYFSASDIAGITLNGAAVTTGRLDYLYDYSRDICALSVSGVNSLLVTITGRAEGGYSYQNLLGDNAAVSGVIRVDGALVDNADPRNPRILQDDTKADVEAMLAALEGKADAEATLAALEGKADAEATLAALEGKADAAALQQERQERITADAELHAEIESVDGKGGYVHYFNFGVAEPEQADITAYVKSQIWPGAEAEHADTEIFNGTRVENEFDGVVWVLANTPDTDPPVFSWEARGGSDISDATQSVSGLMSANDKTKLDGVEAGANKTVYSSSLTSVSADRASTPAAAKELNDKITANSVEITSLNDRLANKLDIPTVTNWPLTVGTADNPTAVSITGVTAKCFNIGSGAFLSFSFTVVDASEVPAGFYIHGFPIQASQLFLGTVIKTTTAAGTSGSPFALIARIGAKMARCNAVNLANGDMYVGSIFIY